MIYTYSPHSGGDPDITLGSPVLELYSPHSGGDPLTDKAYCPEHTYSPHSGGDPSLLRTRSMSTQVFPA